MQNALDERSKYLVMVSLKQSKRMLAKARRAGRMIDRGVWFVCMQSHTGVVYYVWNKHATPKENGRLRAAGNHVNARGGIGWDYSLYVPHVHHYSDPFDNF